MTRICAVAPCALHKDPTPCRSSMGMSGTGVKRFWEAKSRGKGVRGQGWGLK